MKNPHSYLESDLQLAALAKALAHPARLQIIRFLYEKQSCFCGDIVKEIDLAQATLSQHLKELKKQGIIQGQISGSSVCYCINPPVWEGMKTLFQAFLDHDLITKSNCC